MRADARQGRQNAFPPKALDAESFHRSIPGSLSASRRRGCPLWGGEGILPSHAPARARRTRARQHGKGPPAIGPETRLAARGRARCPPPQEDAGTSPQEDRRLFATASGTDPRKRHSRHTNISSYGRVRDFLTLAAVTGPGGEGILPSLAPTGAHAPIRLRTDAPCGACEGKMPSPPERNSRHTNISSYSLVRDFLTLASMGCLERGQMHVKGHHKPPQRPPALQSALSHEPTEIEHETRVGRGGGPCRAGDGCSKRHSRHTNISSYGRVRDFLTLAAVTGPGGEGILPSLAPTGAHAPIRLRTDAPCGACEGKMPSPPERNSRHTNISSYSLVRDFLTLASLGCLERGQTHVKGHHKPPQQPPALQSALSRTYGDRA